MNFLFEKVFFKYVAFTELAKADFISILAKKQFLNIKETVPSQHQFLYRYVKKNRLQ